jgi:hypothetical protein
MRIITETRPIHNKAFLVHGVALTEQNTHQKEVLGKGHADRPPLTKEGHQRISRRHYQVMNLALLSAH